MPSFIPPMLATLASKPFRDPDWLFEIKWDGYRIEAVVDDGQTKLLTRHGNDGETYFPGFLSPPSWIDARQAIVDGEVVALDEDGAPDFGLLQERISELRAGRRVGGLVYQAFDLLYLDGRSLLRVPLEDRKRLLRSVLREGSRVRFASHVETEGLAFYAAAEQRGIEGIIAKHRRSTYEPGQRTRAWLKIKIRPEQELVVGGWTPGEGNAKDLGALVVGVYEGGQAPVRRQGRVGVQREDPVRSSQAARGARGRQAGRSTLRPSGRASCGRAHWIRPELVIRAELGGWTREGYVRQTSFKGLELAKDPTRCRSRATDGDQQGRAGGRDDDQEVRGTRKPPGSAEALLRPPTDRVPGGRRLSELAALDGLGKEGLWQVDGAELKLTNLDKSCSGRRRGPTTRP